MMIAVACIALLLVRSVHFAKLSQAHGREAVMLGLDDLDLYSTMTEAGPGGTLHAESGFPVAKLVEPVRRFIVYHHKLEQKYDWASFHPWLLVASDPPPPPKPSAALIERYHSLLHEE